jgi:hypothetical protein
MYSLVTGYYTINVLNDLVETPENIEDIGSCVLYFVAVQ